MIQTAKDYIAAGFSVLPTNRLSKKTTLDKWQRLQETRLTDEECERAFYGNCNIALICGAISGNLEVLDFDNKINAMEKMFNDFFPIIDTFGLPYEKTPSGGYHVFYRCEEPVEGNKKLAQIYDPGEGKPVTIIETRGEGGYVVVSPSGGYKMIDGSILKIPVISKESRDYIISSCMAFNEIEEKEYTMPDVIGKYNYGDGERAGDRYNLSANAIAECRALLEHHGWTFINDGKYARRPGKKDNGISATLGIVKSRLGVPLLYVFSSNAYPFEPMHSYNPFAIFSMLAYGSDFSAAAKEINERMNAGVMKTRRTEAKLPKFITQEMKAEARISGEENGADEEDLDVPISKKKLAEIEKTETYLNEHYKFRFDTVKHIVEWNKRGTPDWEEANENDIFRSLQHLGIKFSKESISSLLGSSYVKHYDPFMEYFNNLPEWDGIDHFTEIAKYIDVEDKPFFITMLEKQFVRAIKCALEPEFYNRFVFVFRSHAQEIGKSRFVNFLNPFPDRYYTSEALKDDKDSILALTENFIYNLEEIDDTSKIAGGIAKLKAAIARRTVNVRLPYGRQKTLLYRRCTFFGSANSNEFLTDDLNTRWLIANVHSIDEDVFIKINIQDLWAQAMHLYKDKSYIWDLTKEERIHREESNLSHKQSLMEQELIALNFRVPEDPNKMMEMSVIVRELILLAPCGVRLKTDLTYIHDMLVGMGFKEGSITVMNTYIKTFHIEKIAKSW